MGKLVGQGKITFLGSSGGVWRVVGRQEPGARDDIRTLIQLSSTPVDFMRHLWNKLRH